MSIFNVFLRVLRKCLPSLCTFLGVFLGITILIAKTSSPMKAVDFRASDTPIAVINRDGPSELADGLTAYLGENGVLIDLPDDAERLQDELFYRNVQYIAFLPAGFADDFAAGTLPVIETVTVPDSVSARYVGMLVDKYMNTAALYRDFSGLDDTARHQAMAASLAADTPVIVRSFQQESANSSLAGIYFLYLSYAFLGVVPLGISTILMVFNQSDLRRRQQCSPMRSGRRNLQLSLGCAAFAVVCWLIILACSPIVAGVSAAFTRTFLLYALNSLCFLTVCIAIGFLAGGLLNSYNVQSAVFNILSLGMCFLCGVFVPQSAMSPAVLRVSAFLPAYWYVKAVNDIAVLPDFQFGALSPVFLSMLIQLGFATALFSVAFFIGRQRRTGSA